MELPVQSVLYADAPGLGIFGHTLIVVEENARLTYVEEYSSPRTGQPGFKDPAGVRTATVIGYPAPREM